MATNSDMDFESWFGVVQVNVLDQTGVDFRDEDSVRDDYDQGKDAHDVAEEIAAEYNS